MSQNIRHLPAEWHPQSAIQLTWPHQDSDWGPNLKEVTAFFIELAETISKRQKVLVLCQEPIEVYAALRNCAPENLDICYIASNDTWARDHGAITVFEGGKPIILDFQFNGWGQKFPADADNAITATLFERSIYNSICQYEDHRDFVLEGGAIESDGQGTLLTTSTCLLHPNRNPDFSKTDLQKKLKETLGAKRILWLDHGYLVGDDTDSHIDTLARFCNPGTIAYVQCLDPEDEHFWELEKMEKQLKGFRRVDGKPYDLVPLPMADPVYFDGQRLPATYANFLIINGAVLVPAYGTSKDLEASKILQKVFPQREIISINCNELIKQYGSLHCATMQYPDGVL